MDTTTEAVDRVMEIANMTREDLEKALHSTEDMADSLESTLVRLYERIEDLEWRLEQATAE